MLNFAVMYKDMDGDLGTFIALFTDKEKAIDFAVFVQHNGDVPPLPDEFGYYENMVCETEIYPEKPIRHYEGAPIEYINSVAFPVACRPED